MVITRQYYPKHFNDYRYTWVDVAPVYRTDGAISTDDWTAAVKWQLDRIIKVDVS